MIPPKLLHITITSSVPAENWPNDASPYANTPFKWTVLLTVSPQTHSWPNTPRPYAYNGLDVNVGDWVSNTLGGHAWIIRSISSQSAFAVTCVIEDVNQYNACSDSTSNGDGSPATQVGGFLFSTDSAGRPILTDVLANVLTSQWQTDLVSWFVFTNTPFTPFLTLPTTTNSGTVTALTLQNGTLVWVTINAGAATFDFELEDDSGILALENGLGALRQET